MKNFWLWAIAGFGAYYLFFRKPAASVVATKEMVATAAAKLYGYTPTVLVGSDGFVQLINERSATDIENLSTFNSLQEAYNHYVSEVARMQTPDAASGWL